MKKTVILCLYTLGAALFVCFATIFIADCVRYDPRQNSAPLDVILLFRAIEFLLPALFALGGAILIKKQKNKNNIRRGIKK